MTLKWAKNITGVLSSTLFAFSTPSLWAILQLRQLTGMQIIFIDIQMNFVWWRHNCFPSHAVDASFATIEQLICIYYIRFGMPCYPYMCLLGILLWTGSNIYWFLPYLMSKVKLLTHVHFIFVWESWVYIKKKKYPSIIEARESSIRRNRCLRWVEEVVITCGGFSSSSFILLGTEM